MTRNWNISIVETNDTLEAVVTNMDTGESLPMMTVALADFESRDEAVGELFAGGYPNIRDSFDSI